MCNSIAVINIFWSLLSGKLHGRKFLKTNTNFKTARVFYEEDIISMSSQKNEQQKGGKNKVTRAV